MTEPATLGGGRYTVRGVLGEGAQGKTYDAVDANGRSVAIKRFDVRGAKGWKDVELAEREARVLSTIDHPLVPRYIEHFEDDGALFLVMEKVEGETLETIRKREGALSEDEVRRFLADADRALTYLHGRASPIVHRDIKPRNVIRRPNGSYVIVDFGAVAELIQRRGGGSTVVGTMGFMAPEQFQGRALPSTDIYAVGATALSLLAGADPDTLPHQGLKVDVRGALGDRVSPTMIASLEHMLEPDPDRRAQSLGNALDNVRKSTSIPAGDPVAGRADTMVARGKPDGIRSYPPGPSPFAPPSSQHPQPHPAAVYRPPGPGDEMVKSIRRLLWVLWGLGWVLVPVTLGELGMKRGIPPIMFGSLALIIILTWHKGAALRALLNAIGIQAGGASQQTAPPGYTSQAPPPHAHRSAPPPAHRARIDVGPQAQVRVHTTEIQGDELGQTERTSARTEVAAPQRARRL
ncbi:MAG: serine/threonine-protein kinase [Labilithrix sp.]